MDPDAFGCIRTPSENLENFRKKMFKTTKINLFSRFLSSFGGAGAKRTSKSTSASNFAPDTPILRSVRPNRGKKKMGTAETWPPPALPLEHWPGIYWWGGAGVWPGPDKY